MPGQWRRPFRRVHRPRLTFCMNGCKGLSMHESQDDTSKAAVDMPKRWRSKALGDRLERHAGLVFIAPAVFAVLFLIGYPLIWNLYMSLQKWELGSRPPEFIGLANYITALSAPRFHQGVVKTLYYSALATLIPTALGLGAALAFNQRFFGRGFLRSVFAMPMMATPVAVALIWQLMYHPALGVLNYFLSLVNLPPSLWVASSKTVIPSVALVESFQATPFAALVILGGLAALPPELYEASKIDGANAIQRFRFLTFPLIWPYIVVVVLIRSIDALKAFDAIFVLTQGGPGRASETINILLFLQAFNFYHVGYSSSMVVMLFALVVGAALILTRMRRDPSW